MLETMIYKKTTIIFVATIEYRNTIFDNTFPFSIKDYDFEGSAPASPAEGKSPDPTLGNIFFSFLPHMDNHVV